MVRKMVVLPQPDGPRKLKNSPLLIFSVAFRTAVKDPKRMVTRSSSTSALIERQSPGRAHAQQASRREGAGMPLKVRNASDQAALNFSAYCVRSSANQDGSGGRFHSLSSASSG